MSSSKEWINKIWYIYTVDYYLTTKKNKAKVHVIPWLHLKSTMQSEWSHSRRATLFTGTFVWNRTTYRGKSSFAVARAGGRSRTKRVMGKDFSFRIIKTFYLRNGGSCWKEIHLRAVHHLQAVRFLSEQSNAVVTNILGKDKHLCSSQLCAGHLLGCGSCCAVFNYGTQAHWLLLLSLKMVNSPELFILMKSLKWLCIPSHEMSQSCLAEISRVSTNKCVVMM